MERNLPAAESVDVLFVTMPFCDEYMPCLTLALFKSVLARAGIRSRVQHEFLYFASRFGLEKYRSLMQVCTIGYGHDYFACEAVFADAAHGQPLRSFDEYIEWMRTIHVPNKAFAGGQQQDTLGKLDLIREAKDSTAGYLEEAAARVQCEGEGDAAMLYLDTVQPGAALADGLQKALEGAIAQLPIPKVMTYQLAQGTPLPGWDSVQFVRPAHGLVALHGADVVPVTALGLQAGRATHGHRFEAACDPID